MKRIFTLILAFALPLCLSSCKKQKHNINIAATTRPVWEFSARIAEGTDLSVELLISEPISCLHDYSISAKQAQIAEQADVIILSGAGLETAISSLLINKDIIDCSENIDLLGCSEDHDHAHHDSSHSHEFDPHIWLSPKNAMLMATTIYSSLVQRYPQYSEQFSANLNNPLSDLEAVDADAKSKVEALSTRSMITFHDGFTYLAHAYDLTIIKAVEEESGSEASAAELKELIGLVQSNQLPAIFTEENGSVSAAGIIAAETNIEIYALDMAMSERTYFEAMHHNIDTIKEAMG